MACGLDHCLRPDRYSADATHAPNVLSVLVRDSVNDSISQIVYIVMRGTINIYLIFIIHVSDILDVSRHCAAEFWQVEAQTLDHADDFFDLTICERPFCFAGAVVDQAQSLRNCATIVTGQRTNDAAL